MITARCYSRDCGGTWPRNPGKAHEFTEAEAVRLLEWMSEEDWEDGPRCLRHYLDRVADSEWGYRPYDHKGSIGPLSEGLARGEVYRDHSMILTYRPKPDAPWEDVLQWAEWGPVELGTGPDRHLTLGRWRPLPPPTEPEIYMPDLMLRRDS